jgi:hypothetical protein
MMKQKHKTMDTPDKDCEVDEHVKEVFKEVSKEIHNEAKKRRIIVRNASGDIEHELPVTAGVGCLAVVSVFFFPAIIIALIHGYRSQLRLEVIRDFSDEEAEMLDTLEHSDTIHGVQYELGDGQATVAQ